VTARLTIKGGRQCVPTALPLFASGLGVMAWMARRKKRKSLEAHRW
jgi:hypothetical protein